MNKVKSFVQKHVHGPSAEITLPPIPPSLHGAFPDEEDLYRYRKQRGVNLGSWFVLERWITDEPYVNAVPPAQSDHDVARGVDAKYILERHWDTWIVEDDWKWLAEHGITAVRIPIGFYHLCGVCPFVLDGTDFSGFYDVFEGAWARITKAIETAHRYGIGVLIDLHAAPGKQNADSHSGTSSSSVSFFDSANLRRTAAILHHLLAALLTYTRTHNPPLPNLIGIELLNEPNPPQPHAFFHDWYRGVISALRRVDARIPLYAGDSWHAHDYAGMLVSAETSHPGFLVLDHHLYRCFTQEDQAQSAAQLAGALRERNTGMPAVFAQVNTMMAPVGAGLVVGEWSGALNPASLRGTQGARAAQHEFVAAQLELFERECAGWFWWTYKKRWPGDSGWCLRDAVGAGVFPAWVGMRRMRNVSVDGGREWRKREAMRKAFEQHAAYWQKHSGHYEHWRFDDGFSQGWDDAYLFFQSSSTTVPEVGFKAAWVKRRKEAHACTKGSSENLWEYEHGLQQGLTAARTDFHDTYL